ncbi:hypothetical protein GCM10019017_59110 [Streptomyces showdoensis]
MTEEDADLSALVAVRLGSRKDRHGVSCSGSTSDLALADARSGDGKGKAFTVRDRTDTDQGRSHEGERRPDEAAPPVRARAGPHGIKSS